VTAAPALTESALVVLVPEADGAVDQWRQELDPSAALGLPAHITLLYPFAEPLAMTEDVISAIARAIGGLDAFDYQLDEVRWFDDTTVWLAPNPAEPFVALTRSLSRAFPEFPRYGGAVGDSIVPHLTVGDQAPHERMCEAADGLAGVLPIPARAREVALLFGSREASSWRIARTLPLR
jgi:2'-5' RNA ligase